MKIRKLSKDLVAKVAAGEVIESRANIIKELLENSIDANSTEIYVELEKAGNKSIKIIDNGDGMEKEDLEICYKRHTTSKIFTDTDLYSIKSLGFRGEALYAISSVSKVIIKSRIKSNNEGNQIQVINGLITAKNTVAMPEGTQIEISEIFNNVPARRKFKNADSKEIKEIVKTIEKYALIHENIEFKLVNNKREILSFTKNQDRTDRILKIFNEVNAELILENDKEKEDIKIKLQTFKPQAISKYQDYLFIFINKRPIINKELTEILRENYKPLTPVGFYPKSIIELIIPAEKIDVNIHPQKKEVFISEINEIKQMLSSLVQDTFSKNDLTHKYSSEFVYDFEKESYSKFSKVIKENTPDWDLNFSEENEILQIGKLYLVTRTPQGLLLIDQHAAHEKILYNKFLETYNKNKKTTRLDTPVLVKLSEKELKTVKENIELLIKIGYKIEDFGGTDYKLTHAPYKLSNKDIIKTFKETLEDIQNQIKDNLDNVTKKLLSHLACRTAIKSQEFLTKEQREKLVIEVLKTKQQTYTCPHGRPVMIEIGINELHKMFKRK